MIKLLSHLDFTRVGHYQSILAEAGLECFVKNSNASSVMGEVPYTEVWPELWLINESEEARAREVLAEYERSLDQPIEAWTCPQCQTAVEAGFGECWNCGTAKPN